MHIGAKVEVISRTILGPLKRRFGVRVAFFLVAACVFGGFFHRRHRPQVFIHQWSERFRTIENLDAARQLAQSEPLVFLRIFPSGEWFITTCEHSCCSGAGFDATVIRDSSTAIYVNRTHTFCGIEGLGEELGERRIPADSLPTSYNAVLPLELQKE